MTDNETTDNETKVDLTQMRASVRTVTALLRAVANEDRLLLLCQLCQGERSVGELKSDLDIHQPSLSQQLGVLRAEGLVATRREGKRIYYSIADDKVRTVLNTLHGLYCETS
ncbi:metalloregulator ArsR/SmtB family transcription factor [Rhodopila sp.]|jgi:ArsR family transcriptional regulator|uniref:metalloregulator ArsR/SmtB family transcription factor n=1 Tax=Rhodopila sp. TaxID=2480087 RepID=UPI002C1DE3FA|nr:metalloregulator ArsR/SmtB family transcription factor [Rhodopila sp.]HVZ10536.1 metalloregulator ArsR/SmtB family transcription factor [Rhodopila sp.]